MKQVIWMIVFGLLIAPCAYSQEDIIELNSEELGIHQRPLIVFKHAKHADMMACARCHHDYDKFGFNKNSDEGQRCAECHTPIAGKNPISLVKAFHLQCKGCHEKMAFAHRFNPPRTCGKCHTRTDSALGKKDAS
jgi:predicted CXXCH cytochrome family protein